MTQPPEENRQGSRLPGPDDRSLRDQLLRDMSGGECMSLSHIDSFVSYNYSTEPLADRQLRVTSAIGSLLTDGLLIVGDIVGGTDEHVDPWKLSAEEVLARLRGQYVGQYNDWAKWGWLIWFALTPEGEREAEKLESV